MSNESVPTKFASAARSTPAEIERQSLMFQNPRILGELTNAVPNILLILNRNRQIVHANKIVLGVLDIRNAGDLIGLRPGEAMRCAHAFESEGGCGTTEYCRTCGSVRAILTSQRGEGDIQECRIMQEHQLGALDLRIATTPAKVDGEQFTVFAATDISDEKRREVLERLFFHDVLNTAGGIQGYIDILDEASPNERPEFMKTAQQLVRRLVEEIQSQRELTAAERGDIAIEAVPVESKRFLAGLVDLYGKHLVAESRSILVASDAASLTHTCDERLLHRVVGNMIKNALEASAKGTTVTIGCRSEGEDVTYWVHNEGHMQRDVQLQIFQRSFSTKGSGRGLGTYSIKLLGERYLGGTVSFSSTPTEGTTFRIRLPRDPQPAG